MMEQDYRILLTGGGGRLGSALRALLPGLITPDLPEFDITRPADITDALARHRPHLLVHAAAFTDVASAEQQRGRCWQVNVEGTANIVRAVTAHGIPLVHISTDYVFDGTRGQYREDDTPGPVCNYYALTKLVAESLARLAPRHLIIRTSFRPNIWPYPVAFTDVYTSQDYVDIIAPEIARAIRHLANIPDEILHIATERKSVYDLAKRRRPDVQPGSKRDAGVILPNDTSLDTTRWQQLKQQWGE